MLTTFLLTLVLAPSSPFQVGEPAPVLTLPSGEHGEHGEPVSLADFRGQKVMLHVWASW